MSNEPKVTRFGALPTVDAELATKEYVDNSSGGGVSRFFFAFGQGTFTANNDFFTGVNMENFFDTTESRVQTEIFIDFDIIRITGAIDVNTKNGATICGFRDDGVTIASVSIAASTTGGFDSGALSTSIASGSLMALLMDTGASSSGSLEVRSCLFGFEAT